MLEVVTLRPVFITLFLAASLLSAGCLSGTGEAPTEQAAPRNTTFVDPLLEADDGHNHSNPAEHALWTDTMEKLGYHPLGEEPNKTRGTYGEIDIVGDTAFVAVLGDQGETPGVLIVDISDRVNPKVLSFTPVLYPRLADVKGDPSGDYFYVGSQAWTFNTNFPQRFRQPTPEILQDSQKRLQWMYQDGLQIYDARDKTQPAKIVGGAVSEEGCHMIMPFEIAGGFYIFCVGTTINIFEVNPASGSATLVSQYQPQNPEGLDTILDNDKSDPNRFFTEARLGLRPHDMTVQLDPTTGKPVMIASYWDWGLRVVDVSDPKNPKELGRWTGDEATHYEGNVHTGLMTVVEGRRVIVCIPELLSDKVPGVFILDATDLGNIHLLGEWYAPGEHGAEGILFSTHNIQIVDGRLYMAYYHAGVWVLDISTNESLANPPILGYYLPHEAPETYLPPERVNTPDVWDVVVKDGYLYATDIHTGLYVLHYKPDTLGDPTLTSFA
ncbi:MAG TPA: hypothetical protein VNZ52_16410 [Candidatus Thermoplasmatota archaeon]|nr:hypothetical protein [Candidatus Thermoplasmatota archaeon]